MNGQQEIAGRWLRVSSGGQDEAQQEPDVNQWISDHGYTTGPTYRLRASASKGKHQGMLDEALADMAAGRIQVLVVWYSARIERRGAYDHMTLAHRAKLAGGRVEYVKEPQLNEVNAFSNTFLAMHADLNKKFTDDLSMNVLKSFAVIDGNDGIRNKPLFGYTIVGERYHKTFEIVEHEAAIIRDAVAWYLEGDSLAEVCRKLNKANRLPRSGAKWLPKTLSQVLRSETLRGRRHQGNTMVRVPSIIEVADFDAVQAKLDSKAYRKGTRTHGATAFLTSIIHCGKCGRAMYRVNTGHGASKATAYYCRPKDGVSCGTMIRTAKADLEVDNMFINMRELVFTREVTVKGDNHQDAIDHLALDIQALTKTMPEGWLAEVTKLSADMEALKTLPAEPDRIETREMSVDELHRAWGTWPDDERRAMMISYGVKVYAFKVNGSIDLVAAKSFDRAKELLHEVAHSSV